MPKLPVSRVRKALIALVVPAALACIGLAGACTGDEEASDFRRGFPGDSCTRTDDCQIPLRCLKNTCTDTAPEADGGGGTGAGGPSADAGPWGACDQCLTQQCSGAEAACGAECVALEGCIETLCTNLSAQGSPDEGKCQVNCQGQHPDGVDQHLALVDCAQKAACQPPCVPYPQDYETCRAFMDKGDCGPALNACKASADCNAYSDCVKFCSSLAECLACDDTPERLAGRNLLEAYERCVASECTAESWIP